MNHRSDGGSTYVHNGMNYNTDRNGHLSSISRPGMQAHYSPNGSIRTATFSRPGGAQMSVSHGYYGERRVETVRVDHSRVVTWGDHRGFVERPYRPGFVSRTYVVQNRTYVRVYRSYSYRGVVYYGYQPPVFYRPAFYGWAWNPWPRPVVWGWGWRASPWAGFYVGFFQPAPYYPTASLWLTDYLLAEDLRIAYENRMAAAAAAQQAQYDYPPPPPPPAAGGDVMLPPAVKAAIAEEVRLQLEAERAQANQPAAMPSGGNPVVEQAPVVLDPKRRIFIVSNNFAAYAGGQECALTAGDIIVRTSDMPSPQNTVGVSVLSSKPGDCPMNATADVEVAQLCEMHNQFQDHVDGGLQQLASNQGQNGLPPSPPPGAQAPPYGSPQGDPLASADGAIQQQQHDATQAMSDVPQAGGAGQ